MIRSVSSAAAAVPIDRPHFRYPVATLRVFDPGGSGGAHPRPMAGVAQRIALAAPAGADRDHEPVRPHRRAILEHQVHRTLNQRWTVGHQHRPGFVIRHPTGYQRKPAINLHSGQPASAGLEFIHAGYPTVNGWPRRFQAAARGFNGRRTNVSTDDKFDAKADELKGKAKEATGRVTDDEELEAEGKGDQVKGNLKQAVEKVKDAFKD
jgi:uncharacterized protein YjbJ (UPF0337 family)